MPQALLKTSPKNRNPQPRFKNRPIGRENRSPGNTADYEQSDSRVVVIVV